MRWFDGDVGGAIAAAKQRQSLFVVFVTGTAGVWINILKKAKVTVTFVLAHYVIVVFFWAETAK